MLDHNGLLEALAIEQHEHTLTLVCGLCGRRLCDVEGGDTLAMLYDSGAEHLLIRHEKLSRRRTEIHGCDLAIGDVILTDDEPGPPIHAVHSGANLTGVVYADGTVASFTDDQILIVWRGVLR